jgi:hypothetical protein
MSPTSKLLPCQFTLAEAIAFLTLFAVAFAGLQMHLHPLSVIIIGVLIGRGIAIVSGRRKRLILFSVLGAILFPIVSAPFWVDAWVMSIHRGPMHSFTLDSAPKFLSEDEAIEMARKTLALDGFDSNEWKPSEDGRSKSPDGVVDKYLSRNTLNPNDCKISFVKTDDKLAWRIVELKLVGTKLTTYVWLPE